MSSRKENILWLLIEKVIRLPLNLIVGVFVARHLGPSDFGLFNFSLSLVTIFSVIASFGVNSIIVRELVNQTKGKQGEILSTTLFIKIFGSILSMLALVFTVYMSGYDKAIIVLVSIMGFTIFFQSFNVIDYFCQSISKNKYIAITNTVSMLGSSIFKILLVYHDAELLMFAYSALVDGIILISGYLYIKVYLSVKLSFSSVDFSLAKKYLIECWPVLISSLAVIIQARIDQVMINNIVGPDDVGQYSVAMRMVEVFDLIPVLLVKVFQPSIVRAKNSSEDEYREALYNLYRLMMLVFIPVAIILLVVGKPVVLYLYGQEYALAAKIIPLFAVKSLFTNYGVARGVFVTNNRVFKISMTFVIVSSLFNIFANYTLIPIYGVYGAVIATLFTLFLSVFAFNFFSIKTRDNGIIMIKSIFTFYKFRMKDKV